MEALRKHLAARRLIPPLVGLVGDLALDQQLRELPPLRLAFERHTSRPCNPVARSRIASVAVQRQAEVYARGVAGTKPLIPTDPRRLEEAARARLTPEADAY